MRGLQRLLGMILAKLPHLPILAQTTPVPCQLFDCACRSWYFRPCQAVEGCWRCWIFKGESYEESVGNFAGFCRHGGNDRSARFLTKRQEGREDSGKEGSACGEEGSACSEEGSACSDQGN